jgi:SAM-dependent methyltransferase
LNKPTPAELSEYYARRYYQEGLTTYQASYPPEELEHIERQAEAEATGCWSNCANKQLTCPPQHPPFSTSAAAKAGPWLSSRQQGWDVLGLDYSSFSVERFPARTLREKLRTGDLYEQLQHAWSRKAGAKFDVLWLDNVLEHVPDPAGLLRRCRALVSAPAACW